MLQPHRTKRGAGIVVTEDSDDMQARVPELETRKSAGTHGIGITKMSIQFSRGGIFRETFASE
jgi:hypothetical protein